MFSEAFCGFYAQENSFKVLWVCLKVNKNRLTKKCTRLMSQNKFSSKIIDFSRPKTRCNIRLAAIVDCGFWIILLPSSADFKPNLTKLIY